MMYVTWAFTIVHLVASVGWFLNKSSINRELILQHHEKCTMLGLIALAILGRTG